MLTVKSFTCVDCGSTGEQQGRGRRRLRCEPCRKARQAALDSQRDWTARRLPPLPTVACAGCGTEYRPRRRDQRWCSKKCRNAHYNAQFRETGGLSPEARERQRMYWQAKCRRRRAAKRGGRSEPYTLGEIAERDGFCCALCGDLVPMDVKVPEASAPTIDHIVPVSRGGDDTKANVQLAHFLCNSIKGPRDVSKLAPIGSKAVRNGAC